MEDRLRELPTCPFCGAAASVYTLNNNLTQCSNEYCIANGTWTTIKAWNTRTTDPLLEKMAEAYQAACDFIDSHVCDPDITAEMAEKYQAFIEKKQALQEYRKMMKPAD